MSRIPVSAAILAMLCSAPSWSQIAINFSLDSTAPSGRITADIFANLAPTDAWTAAGLRAVAMNGATFHYAESSDPNLATADLIIAPYRNVPITDRHVTSFSRPKPGRSSDARFDGNAGAAAIGQYVPPSPAALANLSVVNVAWYADPPVSFNSPSVDGYIGRLSLDYTVPFGQTAGVGLTSSIPAGATIIMLSEGIPSQPQYHGFATATFDFPQLVQFDWAIWTVPEPSTLFPLLAVFSLIRRLPGFCVRR